MISLSPKKIAPNNAILSRKREYGIISQDLYQKYTQKFGDDLTEIEQKIDFGQNGSSNLEKVTNEAIKVSKNLYSPYG